jgi:hypothetical protein
MGLSVSDMDGIWVALDSLFWQLPDAWSLVVGLRRVSSPFESYEAEDGEMAIRGRSDLWERA